MPKHPLYIQVLFTILAFTAMAALSYLFMSHTVHKHLKQNAENELNIIQLQIQSELQESRLYLNGFSSSVRKMVMEGGNAEALQIYFHQLSASIQNDEQEFTSFNGLLGYFETLEGGNVLINSQNWVPTANYNPTQRLWYRKSLDAGVNIAESLIYRDAITRNTSLIYSVCIFDDDGTRLGVVGIMVNINKIGKDIVATAKAHGSHGMLLSEDLVFLAHANPDYNGRELRDPRIKISVIEEELRATGEVTERAVTSFQKEDSIAFFCSLPNGWYLGLVTPKNQYYKSVFGMAVVLSVLGIIFAMVLIFILVRIDKKRQKSDMESRHKSAFLANMSHEMRTPMNAIIGMTSIGKTSGDEDRKNYCFSKIESASSHLLGVINDVLDMSKIEANKFEISEEEFNFEKMLQQIINVSNFRMDEKNQKFKLNLDRAIPETLIGDNQRLTQVIMNLMGNAVKFTPANGIINLDTRFLGEADGICNIRISVTDSGIGISAEQQRKLFQSFHQAESNTTRKYGGTGLGLAISKNIVEMMGGEIWIESELGKGATFAFTILMKRGAGKTGIRLAQDINRNNLRILAVDDDPDVLQFFSDITSELGIYCDTAASGEEALALSKNQYHIYFIDWKMPVMDGIKLAGKLKAKPQSPGSVIFMMSAAEWREMEKEAQKAGVHDFLAKPLFPSSIVDSINKALGCNYQKTENIGREISGIFAGHYILLAEDVEINREIVLTLLEPTLLNVDCAVNGQEAVRMFRENPDKYEMIFMDLQMPEVDGYDATKRIRSLDIPAARTIPIVAMTANVFKEDIMRCKEAGMNGHIGKPLNFDETIDTLCQFLPRTDERLNNRRCKKPA